MIAAWHSRACYSNWMMQEQLGLCVYCCGVVRELLLSGKSFKTFRLR